MKEILLTLPIIALFASGCVVSEKKYLQQVERARQFEDELQATQKAKADTVAALEKEKAIKDSVVKKAVETEARLKEQVASLSTTFAEKAEGLEKQLAAVKTQTEALNAGVKEAQSALAEAQKSLDAEARKSTELAAVIQEKDLKIADLEAHLTSERNQLAKAHNELASAKTEAATVATRLKEMEGRWHEVAAHEKTVEALRKTNAELDKTRPILSQRSTTIAVFLKQQGKLHEAETEFRNALSLDRHNGKARRSLALLLEEMGHGSEALKEWNALRADPEYAREAWDHAESLKGKNAGAPRKEAERHPGASRSQGE